MVFNLFGSPPYPTVVAVTTNHLLIRFWHVVVRWNALRFAIQFTFKFFRLPLTKIQMESTKMVKFLHSLRRYPYEYIENRL